MKLSEEMVDSLYRRIQKFILSNFANMVAISLEDIWTLFTDLSSFVSYFILDKIMRFHV